MSVLIVDDNEATRQAFQSLLETKGYAGVQTAGSGEEALRLLGVGFPVEGPPPVDVILLDMEMPGMDGIETCRRLKAAEHVRNIPVLIVTARTKEQALELAFAAGACDFLTKPVETPELLARMRSAVRLKDELDTCKARERDLVQVTDELKRLNEELRRLAILDDLTGIANRRFFNHLLAQEWARAARAVVPLSLVLIDIDFFKRYNDYYGHQKGDQCLKRVAQALNGFPKRPGDNVARYGGEEFVVLLTHTGVQGAAAVAERLRAEVEGLSLEHACSPMLGRVTISAGVATAVPERRGAAELLLTAADQAVYQAKRDGRNRVKVYAGLPDEAAVLRGPPASERNA